MTHIKIIDDEQPEDIAMMQALYSRSPASVEKHLEKVRRVGSGQFMEDYYIGYRHQSIGDCGTTTLFLEGVRMLDAKAFQDWPLYSGQEASTRYMDFSKVEFCNPVESHEGRDIQEAWRSFYIASREPLIESLRERYPRQPDEEDPKYERAIAARAFDILRGFLPAGASTNLSWHTNLRQAADHLQELSVHPDPTVRREAFDVLESLRSKYPHSFIPRDDPDVERYYEDVMDQHYFRAQDLWYPGVDRHIRMSSNVTWGRVPLSMRALIRQRPRGAQLPRTLLEYGQVHSEFYLDFGSFRDLQRHRNGTVRMPLLVTDHGFHPWYLGELPEILRADAERLVESQTSRIDMLPCDPFTRQSYIAMGFRVPCRITQGLPALVYRLELRSSKTVHPTLREIVLQEAKWFSATLFPEIPIYVDTDPCTWTIRRGDQTILEK